MSAEERCIYCGKTRSAHGLSSRLCLQGPGGTTFTPATSDAGGASEVEALAEVALLSLALRQAARDHLGLDEGEHWPSGVAVAQSRAILASDWLAAREAAARAEERERIAQAIEAVAEAHLPWLRSDYEEAARIARGDS